MDGVAKHMFTTILSSKLKESVTNTVKYNIYTAAVIKDMNSAQSLMAAYFHFLVAGDVRAAVTFLDILGEIPQIASSYIGVWLRDDFRFNRKDVAQALNTLARIVVSQRISVNSPLVSSVTCLEEKYSLFGYFTQYVIVWAEETGKLAAQVSSVPLASNTSATPISSQAPANVPSMSVTNTTAATAISSQSLANVSSFNISATAITTQAPADVPSMSVTNTAAASAISSQSLANVPSVSVTNTAAAAAISSQSEANVTGDTLESAVGRNDAAAIASLARGNVNEVTVSGHSLLFTAVSEGFVEAATALCAAGAEWRGGEVSTLLDKALDTDSPAIIEALAKSGVDLASLKDNDGDTYLHLAAGEGTAAIVEAMLDGGVDIDIKGCWDRTALHCASFDGDLSTVQLLLLRGAAVNVGDDFQSTPLHDAAGSGRTEVIAALCAAGAEVNRRDENNRTPLGAALAWNKPEAAKLLRSKGGVK